MKITRIETVQVPELENTIWVVVHTDEGITGLGASFRSTSAIQLLVTGYAIGVALAGLLTFVAITTRLGSDFLETMTSIFNPLPAIALLPLALTWFGLGASSLVFVLVHSVLWAVALNTHSGFLSVSPTLRMVGRNYGLNGLRLVFQVFISAALPSILTGLKIGWAFAWRTLIAAELVFGVSSGKSGLGWSSTSARTCSRRPTFSPGC